MITFLVARESGEITTEYSLVSEEIMKLQPLKAGEFYIQGVADASLQYIDTATKLVMEKPAIVAVISPEVIRPAVLTIKNLPVPCDVKINDMKYNVPDGVFEVSFDYPADYEIVISALNMIPFKGAVAVI